MLLNGKKSISSIPSADYAQRFYEFMKNDAIIDDKETIEERKRLTLNSTRSSRRSQR